MISWLFDGYLAVELLWIDVHVTPLCRYEAALILKNACLKDLALGEVLQILDIIITMKKWITLPQSGWQPIAINIAETNSD